MIDGSGRNGESASGQSEAGRENGTVPRDVLELDHLFEALAHPRRRYLCYALLESAERSLADLAGSVAAWESDVPEGAVTGEQREEVYLALYHAHVPKLVENGVVTFDEATGTVAPGEHAEQVLAALEEIGARLAAAGEDHARSGIDDGG